MKLFVMEVFRTANGAVGLGLRAFAVEGGEKVEED